MLSPINRRYWLAGLPLAGMTILVCGLTGCGSGDKQFEKLRAYPVKGVLTMDGQPFGPILLLLQSTDPKGPLIRGESDDKGILKFTTNKIGDGAPLGDYKILFPKDPLGREGKTVPEVYRNFRTSPLTVQVEKKKTEWKIALDSKAELPNSEFADPTLGPIKRKAPTGRVKVKEKTETEKPRPSTIDPKVIR